MNIQNGYGWKLDEYETEQLGQALGEDPFFARFHSDSLLSTPPLMKTDSFATVLKVCMGRKPGNDGQCPDLSLAVKFDRVDKVEEIEGINETMLEKMEGYSKEGAGTIALRFLNAIYTPYIIQPIADRYVLMTSRNPENDWEEEDAYSESNPSVAITKLVRVFEHANLGDMEKYAVSLKNSGAQPNDVLKIAIDLLHKISYSLETVQEFGKLIHGDISPVNILVRSCGAPHANDVCPVISDWDQSYYNGGADNQYKIADFGIRQRYSHQFEPVEMILMAAPNEGDDEDYLYSGVGGYKFTFKEDVYALGMTMLYFLKQAGLVFEDILANDKFFELLKDMISPVLISDAYPWLDKKYAGFYEHSPSFNLAKYPILAPFFQLKSPDVQLFLKEASKKHRACAISPIFTQLSQPSRIVELIEYALDVKKCADIPDVKVPFASLLVTIDAAAKLANELNFSAEVSKDRLTMLDVKKESLKVYMTMFAGDSIESADEVEKKMINEWEAHITNTDSLRKEAGHENLRHLVLVSSEFEAMSPEGQMQVCSDIKFYRKALNDPIAKTLTHLRIHEICSDINLEHRINLAKQKKVSATNRSAASNILDKKSAQQSDSQRAGHLIFDIDDSDEEVEQGKTGFKKVKGQDKRTDEKGAQNYVWRFGPLPSHDNTSQAQFDFLANNTYQPISGFNLQNAVDRVSEMAERLNNDGRVAYGDNYDQQASHERILI